MPRYEIEVRNVKQAPGVSRLYFIWDTKPDGSVKKLQVGQYITSKAAHGRCKSLNETERERISEARIKDREAKAKVKKQRKTNGTTVPELLAVWEVNGIMMHHYYDYVLLRGEKLEGMAATRALQWIRLMIEEGKARQIIEEPIL